MNKQDRLLRKFEEKQRLMQKAERNRLVLVNSAPSRHMTRKWIVVEWSSTQLEGDRLTPALLGEIKFGPNYKAECLKWIESELRRRAQSYREFVENENRQLTEHVGRRVKLKRWFSHHNGHECLPRTVGAEGVIARAEDGGILVADFDGAELPFRFSQVAEHVEFLKAASHAEQDLENVDRQGNGAAGKVETGRLDGRPDRNGDGPDFGFGQVPVASERHPQAAALAMD